MINSPLYQHQQETVDFLKRTPRAFVTSTPGCGKTRSTLQSIVDRQDSAVIICPKSIMQAAWGNDIEKFFSGISYAVLDRKKYNKSHEYIDELFSHQFVIINPEAAKLVLQHKQKLRHGTLVIDEFTSIKNKDAQRSKHIEKLAQEFNHRILLSGTPIANSITDIWHPAYVLDGGQRLGANFFSFRNSVCQPVERGKYQKFVEWQDIPEAHDVVGDLLRDITIRHELE